MTTSESIFKKVVEIISDQLGVDKSTVNLESDLQSDLDGDSLDIVELIMRCEEEFGVQIPDHSAEKMRTVGDVVDYLKENS